MYQNIITMEYELAPKSLRIYEIARKLGITEKDVVAILSRAGFSIRGDVSNYILNNKQIIVINKHFIEAIKNLFKQSKKNYHDYDNMLLDNLRRFLSNFVLTDSDLTEVLSHEDFFKLRLDIQSIEAYFQRLLYSYEIKDNSVVKILKELKYRITSNLKCNNDFRKKDSIFFFSRHYYIFSDEDSLNASQFFRFKSLKNKMTEALNKLLIELKHLYWNQKKQHLLQG